MHEHVLASAHRLSDDALHERLKLLAGRERGATVELVAHLAVLLDRKKHLGQGWGSVYRWCIDVLHLSADAADNRVAAARAVRRFPVILDHLAAGFLNVTTVKVLRPVLTRENHRAILAEANYRTRNECEEIVARLQPKADVPSPIRAVPVPASPPLTLALDGEDSPPQEPPRPPSPPPPRSVVAPLTPERFRVEMSIWKHTRDKLGHIQNLLCREVPDGDVGAIFDRALDALKRELEREKRAATPAPRAARPSKPGSRHVPAAVARAVWARDGEQCAFIGTEGRCRESRYLELHHVDPYAGRTRAVPGRIVPVGAGSPGWARWGQEA